MQERISKMLCAHTDLYLFDEFPIPLTHIKRTPWKSPLKGIGSVGYCAAKDQKYFGFKYHLVISPEGATKALTVALANQDERDILTEIVFGVTGDLIADKGLIRPSQSICGSNNEGAPQNRKRDRAIG
jgi:hypothetical protein